jgi:DNA-directed RNA polymerase subunit RPC12/RpoP
MAPFAFCSNPKCRRVFDFCESGNEMDRSPTVLPPSACPVCNSKVVAWCPRCMQSIANKPEGDEPKCVHCSFELIGPVKAKPLKTDNTARRIAAGSD